MNNQIPPDEADNLSALIGTSPTTFAPPPSRELKPWHKPRKQWIRENQWDKNCRELIANTIGADEEFKYLSLPGPDLLDVRFIAQTCADLNKRLKFLGFNNPSDETPEDQMSLSKGAAEIVQSQHVSTFSSVVPDRLENLALENSVAKETIAQFGSFDAINLDLCNSMLGYVPLAQQTTYYDALHALFEHQKTYRTKPFLLFITTRTGQGTMNPKSVAKLGEAVKKNLQNNEFKTRLKAEFGVQPFEVNNLVAEKKLSSSWSQRKLSRFVSVALGKWLLGLLWSGHPRWKIRLVDSCEYKVLLDRDMLSVSFICEPVRESAADASKLSKHVPLETNPSATEQLCGLHLLDQCGSTFDLDAKLSADATYPELVERAARLMESAGYSVADYKAKFQNA